MKTGKTYYVVASLILFGMSAPAMGQNSTEEVLEEIVVTGTRADLNNALVDKRSSDVVSDSIVASDIGNLPDVNIADSLQRVPGVQVQRNDRGQTADVTIRGLPSSFTQVLYNGRPVSTVFNDSLSKRSFQAFVVPSAFVKKLGVAKTSIPDAVEGGIAGTVNVTSQKAFDYNERRLVFDARGRLESNSGDITQNYSALYADQFADDRVGFLIGINWNEEVPDMHRARGGQYASAQNERAGRDLNGDGDFVDKGIIVRNNVVLENFKQDRERLAVVSNLEWRPTDDFGILLDVLYADQETNNDRESIRIDVRKTDTVSADQSSVVLNGTEYVSRYASVGALVRPEGELQTRVNELLVTQLSADWTVGEWLIEMTGGTSRSTQDQDRFRAVANGPRIPMTIDFLRSDSPPAFALTDSAMTKLLDPSEYSIRQLTDGPGVNIENEVRQTDFFVDFTREVDWGPINSIKFGGYYADNEYDSNRDAYTLSARELKAIGIDEYQYFATTSGKGSFLGSGGVTVPKSFIVPDVRALLSQFGKSELLAADGGLVTDSAVDIVDIDEVFSAGYVRADFSNASGRVSGNIGVRYVNTDETVGGNSIDIDAGFVRDPEDGSLTPVRIGETRRGREYKDVLPSLNLRFDVADDHVFRLGLARTIERPAPAQLDLVVSGLRGGLGEDNEISFNDPALDPFRSDNLDVSWSWYYSDEALFSLAYFHKDMESLINQQTIQLELPVTTNGVTADEVFFVDTETNDSGVELSGIEVQIQQPFTSLPGLLQHTGIKANYTYIDNSAPDRLRAAAEDNYNVVLYFDNKVLDARLSYTFRGDYLFDTAIGSTPPEIFQEREFLAVNVTYHVNDNLELFLNGSNLTDDPGNRIHEGGLARQYQDFGRAITVGVTGHY